MKDYEVILTEMRTSRKKGLRYATVRAVANGIDSYKSVFTKKARESIVKQLKSNGVKSNALHKNAIDDNLTVFLSDKLSRATGKEKETIESLLGNLANRQYPIGKVVDAKFNEDNTIEATIVENDALKLLGEEQANYLDANWDMVEGDILGGASLVFNGVESFNSNGTLFIDDANVLGLDFVDRQSHPNTKVLETFTRAAQQSINEVNNMTNEEPNTQEPPKTEEPKQDAQALIDEAAKEAAKRVEENAQKAKEAEDALLKDKEALKSEYEAKIKEAEEKATNAEKVAKEAIEIGEELVKEKAEIAARIDNPFAEQAKKMAEQGKDPLEGLGFADLMKLKLEGK